MYRLRSKVEIQAEPNLSPWVLHAAGGGADAPPKVRDFGGALRDLRGLAVASAVDPRCRAPGASLDQRSIGAPLGVRAILPRYSGAVARDSEEGDSVDPPAAGEASAAVPALLEAKGYRVLRGPEAHAFHDLVRLSHGLPEGEDQAGHSKSLLSLFCLLLCA